MCVCVMKAYIFYELIIFDIFFDVNGAYVDCLACVCAYQIFAFSFVLSLLVKFDKRKKKQQPKEKHVQRSKTIEQKYLQQQKNQHKIAVNFKTCHSHTLFSLHSYRAILYTHKHNEWKFGRLNSIFFIDEK